MKNNKKMLKGIYLGAYQAYHENYNLDYNDIKKTSKHINIINDMLEVDLKKYDYIIATPPCNYWSRANYRRDTSKYALKTKHLLPDIINKLATLGKPFIVENVRNKPLFDNFGLNDSLGVYVYYVGRHTYFTNIEIPDIHDIEYSNKLIQNTNRKYRETDIEVFQVIEKFLKVVHKI